MVKFQLTLIIGRMNSFLFEQHLRDTEHKREISIQLSSSWTNHYTLVYKNKS